MALYEPGAVYVSGGDTVVGRQAIRESYSAILAGSGRMTLTTRSVVESGDGMAVLHGAWSIGAPSETDGVSTEVVRRQGDGSWLFAIDIPYTPGAGRVRR